MPPSITITGGGGVGASATCSITTSGQGVIRINVTDGGIGYSTAPTITIGAPPNSGIAKTAVGIASIGRVGNNEDVVGNDVLNAIYIQDPGRGYSSAPTVIISDPDVIKFLVIIFSTSWYMVKDLLLKQELDLGMLMKQF